MTTILIIEDDEQLSQLISEYLSSQGFYVKTVADGLAALPAIESLSPDLVLLDLMLPGKDGISICREARFVYDGPIMMLTASSDNVDQILGLEIGADDFVTKPVEPRVLLARIKALLRRDRGHTTLTKSTQAESITVGKLNINISARTVRYGDETLLLSTSEYEVLLYLAQNAGTIVSRDKLFQALKNLEYDGQNRFIDITISQIRKKLQDGGEEWLKTVRGQGYLLAVPED